jgi:glycosyltransferase involved in cell wall biosynthesis
MKVAVIAEGAPRDPRNFVGPIRLFDPLDAVAERHPVEWSCIHPGDAFDRADVVIMQRTPFASVEAIAAAAERFGRSKVPLLWEIDDHLFCDELRCLIERSVIDTIDEEAFLLGEAHRALLPFAAALICSTEPLAAAMRGMQPSAEVHMIPVALNFDHPRWRVPARRRGAGVTIGWSGGSRVGRDLELIGSALHRVMRKRSDIQFVLAGSEHYAPLFQHLPRFATSDWVPYDDYPRFVSRFDAVVIPMDDHAYNRCKSGLKVIDHAAVGVPAVCSPTPPFLGVADCVAAFAEREDEWIAGIEKATSLDAASRAHLCEYARDRHHVRNIVAPWWNLLRQYA